ncbi:MAG: hypothetical protein UT71_C0025G0003 [Parcubacteria group bacterium GW2011_GWF2_40_10]|nr:MAG: hypothetical protein UT71_C0025G0003 [Parcubacteria group bacterium GW2011_GWF2_40_10]KKR81654.1 MAG: hypothetical protein UU28_C0023G0008 [Parcubacteria group bacterium GW2011_GWD2_40_9]
MKQNLAGLANVNIELTSRCNKSCWMCGRRKIEGSDKAIKYGDMDFNLVKKIAKQLPSNISVQFHRDGEPLLYSNFGRAIKLFNNQITNVVTNGKLLLEKFDEVVGNLDTMAISVFEGDTEQEEQLEIIKKFLARKKDKKPFVSIKLVGNVNSEKYQNLGTLVIRRVLHNPMGNFEYQKKNPTIPEIGICLDFLRHMCINREGKISICVRFDPEGIGVIGNANKESLLEAWNSSKRLGWLELHKQGKRGQIPPCKKCQYWGVPTG